MSAENQFFNFHLEASCSNSSKIGFQSLNSDVAALKKNLSVCRKWAEDGALQDGDVIVIYARYTESDAAQGMQLSELHLADGTTRKLPEVTAADTEEDDEIPF